MKIVTIIGARPQFIKAATVSRALASRDGAEEIIVHTGQHFDPNMSEVFFSELRIPEPDHNLGISGGTHGDMTGRMLAAIEEVLLASPPDIMLIYGDTNSTLAGALAASKLHIPVAHVEAGLRSFNRRMPEEINRVVADHVSDLLFTPTDTATANLQREGIAGSRIHQVGDVMFDGALFYASQAEESSTILSALNLQSTHYVLATIHRQENTDVPERLRAIIDGLNSAAVDMKVVLPLHPRTRRLLEGATPVSMHPDVQIIKPVGYLDMVMLERGAAVIATDSGGVQKEAYFHRVPCVTLRDETEWVELVNMGWNRLAPPGHADIAATILDARDRRGTSGTPYGDGHAAERIVESIMNM
jgi:UDP-GlcNAc3NAcA epimerase